MKSNIGNIRLDYMLKTLHENEAAEHPMQQFDNWWSEAMLSDISEVNAMALSTVSLQNIPSIRIVLLKEFNDKGFIFYTNYQSRKAQAIAHNPHVSLVFFWKELQRQISVEGIAEKVDAATSDAYFQSRPYGSRIGAWSSPQSEIISSRDVLQENELQYRQQFPEMVPRPSHWGGYLIKPQRMEFWQGRSNRLHDRLVYVCTENTWSMHRLAP